MGIPKFLIELDDDSIEYEDKIDKDDKLVLNTITNKDKIDSNNSRTEEKTLSDDFHSLKLIVGEYFKSISSGVSDLANKINLFDTEIKKIEKRIDNIESRVSMIEIATESSIEEIIKYFLLIFNNLNDKTDKNKKILIKEIGRDSTLTMLKKMKLVIESQKVNKILLKNVNNLIEMVNNTEK